MDTSTGMVITMRAPCQGCGGTRGEVTKSNGQNVAHCVACGAYCYCPPKAELGEAPSQVRTRPTMKPSQRARVLERDNHVCVSCHRDGVTLHIGHLLSVEDGRALGATDAELWDDANLAAMCDACNLGQGRESMNLRFVLRVLRANIGNRDGWQGGGADVA